MRLIQSVALFAVLASPLVAMADPIVFGSGISTVTYSGAPVNTNPNGQPDLTPSAGTAVAFTGTNPFKVGTTYPNPLAGTYYITYDNTSEYLSNGVTNYFLTVTVAGINTATGSVTFIADNMANLYVNGVLDGTSNSFTSFTTSAVTLNPGANIIEFSVTNDTSPYGTPNPTLFDFYGSVTPTPEPSSMVLLGTGLLAVAGFGRRKFLKA